MCEIITYLNERDNACYHNCADCPYAAECAREEDPEIPY